MNIECAPDSSLVTIANRLFPDRDLATSKSDYYYQNYEPILGPLASTPAIIFELGVFDGISTKIFATYFRNGRIVGIDCHLKPIDFTEYPNVALEQGDQADAAFLNRLADTYAPDGIDVVIDDASHIGHLSLKSFEILLPRLRSGGVYIVEDWGTGYCVDWPDGSSYRGPVCDEKASAATTSAWSGS